MLEPGYRGMESWISPFNDSYRKPCQPRSRHDYETMGWPVVQKRIREFQALDGCCHDPSHNFKDQRHFSPRYLINPQHVVHLFILAP